VIGLGDHPNWDGPPEQAAEPLLIATEGIGVNGLGEQREEFPLLRPKTAIWVHWLRFPVPGCHLNPKTGPGAKRTPTESAFSLRCNQELTRSIGRVEVAMPAD
jgi:hypothetical protein